MYEPKIRTSKYIKPKLIELKQKNKQIFNLLRKFNIPFSITDRTSRQKK